MIGRLALMGCILALGCAAQQATRTTATLFETPEAELARELAPDLYGLAEAARAKADAAGPVESVTPCAFLVICMAAIRAGQPDIACASANTASSMSLDICAL